MEITLAHCNINIEPIDTMHYPKIVRISLLHLDLVSAALNNVLKFCKHLQELSLTDTIRTPEHIEMLAANLGNYSNLKELDISDNCIGDEGAKMLASGLIFCTNLERQAPISRQQVAFVQIFTALKQNSLTVNSKDLFHRNEITDKDLISSLEICVNLQALQVSMDSCSTSLFSLHSRKWKHLKVLNLHCAKFFNTDIGLAVAGCLAEFKELKELTLINCRIGTPGAIAIADALKSNCKCLQILNLSLNCIEEGGVIIRMALQENNGLLKLNLSANLIGNSGLAMLVFNPISYAMLRVLNLGDNSIEDEGIKALSVSRCHDLRVLILNLNKVKCEGARALSSCLEHCCKLQELNLGVNSIGGEGAKAIAAKSSQASSLPSSRKAGPSSQLHQY